jgi:hypothetical protein
MDSAARGRGSVKESVTFSVTKTLKHSQLPSLWTKVHTPPRSGTNLAAGHITRRASRIAGVDR